MIMNTQNKSTNTPEHSFRINNKPAMVGFFMDAEENDCAITIQTHDGQLMGLTKTDTQQLINKLTETLNSFDYVQKKSV